MGATATATQLNEHVLQFLSKPKKMLIDGKWVDATSGKTFATLDPSTEEALVQVAEGDKQDVDLAVKAARRAFENGPWRKMTPSERGRAIWKLADLMEQNLEQFAELETLDNGKPIGVARAADVPLAVDLFRYMAGWATKVEGTTIPISVEAWASFGNRLHCRTQAGRADPAFCTLAGGDGAASRDSCRRIEHRHRIW